MTISRVLKLVRETTGAESLRLADDLRKVDIEIALPEKASSNTPLLAHLAVALALRCATGRVLVRGPQDQPGLATLGGSLREQLLRLEEEYSRARRLTFVESRAAQAVLTLEFIEPGAVAVSAAGWTAHVNELPATPRPAVAPAIAFAICAAFAKLFAGSVLHRSRALNEQWSFSLWEMTPAGELPDSGPLCEIELGRVAVLGAGAIGSGLGYILRESGWTGEILFIDNDSYEDPNHETTITMGLGDVNQGPKKAHALADKVRRPGLSALALVERIGEGHPVLSEQRAAFLCAVDNSETRRNLDACRAGVLLNAAVGGSREDAGHVMWSRHEGSTRKLSSLYPASRAGAATGAEDIPNDVDECSRLSYENASLAAPFLGVAAGALLAASLGRRAAGGPEALGYFKIDLFGRQAKYDAGD